jgi:ubiquinone biosynthesis monooxygenase Coq7
MLRPRVDRVMTSSPLPCPPGTDAAAPAADAGPSVYYDGGCPLCRAEIAAYQRAEGGAALRWVDAHGCGAAELGPGLERPAALARLHVRRADGTLLQGAAAFAEIWAALPRWRWLARLARLPGVLPLLELGYRGFLRVRPLWRRPAPAGPAALLPRPLRQELRTDHAGETGAVMIYRGVLAVTRDRALRDFALHHLETERRHLVLVEQVAPPGGRSRLLPLWRVAGWLTGVLPALFGPRAVYATIQAVETFVDRHYAAQVAMIDALLRQPPPAGADAVPQATLGPALERLRELIVECQRDEVAHRDDAAGRWDGRAGVLLRAWQHLVGQGSELAVRVCRHL